MAMVSIVMTTYNGEKYLTEQLDSILSSVYHDFDLYIYDDGSSDATMEILNQYQSRYQDQIYIVQNKENKGVTLNFLHGISRTTSDYIMLCDQDDVWKQNKIAQTLKRIRQMEAQEGKDIPMAVFTDAQVVDKDLKILQASFFCSSHLNPKKTDLSHMLMENKLIGCTVMMNAALRKILQSHLMPKAARFHDGWIGLIAASFGKIGFVNEGTLLYRQHGVNLVGNTSFTSYMKNRITSLKTQKEALLALQNQAEEFLMIYQELLSERNQQILECFGNLHRMPPMKRRIIIMKYGYWKTGIIRNAGLMFLI